TDDNRRAVDAPRNVALRTDEALRLELRPVVRRGQPLPLVEHRLGEPALVVTGHRDRRNVVEATGAKVGRSGDRLLGAADVDASVGLLVRGHVVERGEM